MIHQVLFFSHLKQCEEEYDFTNTSAAHKISEGFSRSKVAFITWFHAHKQTRDRSLCAFCHREFFVAVYWVERQEGKERLGFKLHDIRKPSYLSGKQTHIFVCKEEDRPCVLSYIVTSVQFIITVYESPSLAIVFWRPINVLLHKHGTGLFCKVV